MIQHQTLEGSRARTRAVLPSTPSTTPTGRKFHVWGPTSYDPTKTYPVVLVYHGWYSTGLGHQTWFKMEENTQNEAFVVYPDSDGKPMADNTVQHRWIVTIEGNLLAQFAAKLAVAAAVDAGPELAAKLRGQFAAHGLLARVPALDHYDPHEAEDGTEIPPERHALPWVAVTASDLALPLLLCPASQQPRLFAAPPRAPMARPRTRSRRSPKPAAMRRP